MKTGLSKVAPATGSSRLACFDLGQKVTEVGAALAYAEHFARRADPRDLSTGLHTAALALDRLAKTAGHLGPAAAPRLEARARELEREVKAFNDEVRNSWVARGVAMPQAEAAQAQRKTWRLRARTMEIWSDLRMACDAGRGRGKAKARKGK